MTTLPRVLLPAGLCGLLLLGSACGDKGGDDTSTGGDGGGGDAGTTDGGGTDGGGTDGGGTADGGGTDGGGTGDGGGTDGGGTGDGGGDEPPPGPYNVLVLLSDDLGIDASVCYTEPAVTRAAQPNIQALCRRGVVFDSAWANPVCSPSRAALLTGRYGHHTGLGEAVGDGSDGLVSTERILPQALDLGDSGYAHAAFGKWHLSAANNGGNDHPNLAGFGHFSGNMDGEVEDYFAWERITNGSAEAMTTYATTQTVDDALGWINTQDTPWFAWVAFNAPHSPLHVPPEELHSYTLTGTPGDIASNPVPYFQAMVEAMDTEIGRLLAGIPEETLDRTVILYLGDNGTWDPVDQNAWPAEHAKGSLYQGGVRVPFIVAGPVVVDGGRRAPDMVDFVDVFPTIVDIAGLDPATVAKEGQPLDGRSILPVLQDPDATLSRTWQMAEWFGTRAADDVSGQAVSQGTYKLIRFENGTSRFFDIITDEREMSPINVSALSTEQQDAYDFLEGVLDDRPLPD